MTDVNAWDPIDDGNSAAPPNGWPEFMQPSAVNNSARMMMGAIRRMYDQQISGSIVLPYLPLVGGTVVGATLFTGGVTVNSLGSSGTIHSNTDITADGSISAIGAISSGGNITATGNIQGAGVGGTFVSSTGNVNAATNYQIGGVTFANRDTITTYLYDPSSTWTISAASNGNNYYANTVHWFQNRGNTGTYAAIGPSGMTVNGTITAATATIGGNVNAGSAMVSGNASVSGTFSTPRLSGGAGDAGTLKGWGTGNSINFRWDSGSSSLLYRIDEVLERIIATVPATMSASLEDLIATVQQLVARVEALEGRP